MLSVDRIAKWVSFVECGGHCFVALIIKHDWGLAVVKFDLYSVCNLFPC